MPKIPRHISQEKPAVIPGVRVSPESMTQDIRAMGQFGEAMSRVGAEFTESLRKAREVHQATNAETESIGKFDALEEDLAKDRDYKTYKERFDKRKNEIWNDISSQITEPNALTYARRAFDRESVKREHTVNSMARVVEIDTMKGDFIINLDESAKRGDPQMINKLIIGAVSSGVITAERGETERLKALKSIDVYRASSAIIADPDAAIKSINDKELYPNLDESSRYSLIQRAEIESQRRKRIAEHEIAVVQDGTDREFLGLLAQNELKMETVLEAVKNNTIDSKDGRFYIKALEKEKDGVTDPDVFVSHRIDISNGEKDWKTIQREIKESYVLGDLSQKDFSVLINKIDSYREKGRTVKDPGYKRASDYLKSQIMPSRGMFVGESSEEAKDYYEALLELDRRIDEAQKEGKPLSGNDIVREAMEVAPLYKKTMTERIQALKTRIEKEKTIKETGEKDYEDTAISILEANNKVVNKKTIRMVVERLKKLEEGKEK